MKPVLCKAGQQLREQFDDTFPDRDRTSDGWIADARHMQAGTSDHIPDAKTGVVEQSMWIEMCLVQPSPTSCPILLIRFDSMPRQTKVKELNTSYSREKLLALAWGGASENTREAIRTISTAIFLSIKHLGMMVLSLTSRYSEVNKWKQ